VRVDEEMNQQFGGRVLKTAELRIECSVMLAMLLYLLAKIQLIWVRAL
jgi:hypothetical protein